MTPPPAATAAAARPLRHAPTPVPRGPRRVSGPARPTRTTTRRPPAKSRLSVRIARQIGALPDSRLLDRLIRGRGWIGLVGVALIGIVFMQVSLLKLNAGIGGSMETAQVLERENANMRAELSRLDAGDRIQEIAQRLGMVTPPAKSFRYLTAGRPSDAREAAAAIRPPRPVEQVGVPVQLSPPPVTSATVTPSVAASPASPSTGAGTPTAAPAGGAAPTTAQAAPQQQQTQPAAPPSGGTAAPGGG